MKRAGWVSIICVLCLSFGMVLPAGANTEVFEQHYDVEPGTRLELKNRNGEVRISQWDESRVRVYAKKKAQPGGNLKKVDIIVETGDTLRIETVYLVNNPRVTVNYEIHVPAGTIVAAVENSNGLIRLENIEGGSSVKTSNGKIVIRNAAGNILAETSNGEIDIQDVTGDVTAETSNGSISISSVTGIASGKTSNGKIKVEKVGGLRDLTTSSGYIEAEIPAIFTEDLLLKNSNGAIKVKLPSGLNAELELKTSNGNINLHEIEVLTSKVSKNSLKGRIGAGGALLKMKTSNGAIDLYPLD